MRVNEDMVGSMGSESTDTVDECCWEGTDNSDKRKELFASEQNGRSQLPLGTVNRDFIPVS